MAIPTCGSNPPYYEKYIEKYIFIGYNLLGRSSGIENL
jgi:hypothetical protein